MCVRARACVFRCKSYRNIKWKGMGRRKKKERWRDETRDGRETSETEGLKRKYPL